MPLPFSQPMTLESIKTDLENIDNNSIILDTLSAQRDFYPLFEFFQNLELASLEGQEEAFDLILEIQRKVSREKGRQAFISAVCRLDNLWPHLRSDYIKLLSGIEEVNAETIPYAIREYIDSLDIPKSVIR